jgi:hypothetical protein
MQISLIREGIPNLLPQLHRSPGIHLSDIIQRICIDRGIYTDTSDDPILFNPDTHQPTPLTQTRWQLGCALETAITNRYQSEYPNTYVSPGELYLDNIPGTPDLGCLDDGLIDEIKLSWQSSIHTPDSDKFLPRRMQLMAYLKMIGVRVGRLHVCNVNGDYRGDRAPVYRVWQMEFSERELNENWLLIKSYRRSM